MSAPVLLRAAARELRPWKNGGGRTSEVTAFPRGSGMDDFGWRISIADVDADGPFSTFPIVERHIAILAGTLRLRFEDADRVMSVRDEPFSFSGGAPVVGLLVDGPVRDLNLMVRTDRYAGSLRRVGPGRLAVSATSIVVIALQTATVSIDDETFDLLGEDAVLVSGQADVTSSSPLILAELRHLASDQGHASAR